MYKRRRETEREQNEKKKTKINTKQNEIVSSSERYRRSRGTRKTGQPRRTNTHTQRTCVASLKFNKNILTPRPATRALVRQKHSVSACRSSRLLHTLHPQAHPYVRPSRKVRISHDFTKLHHALKHRHRAHNIMHDTCAISSLQRTGRDCIP